MTNTQTLPREPLSALYRYWQNALRLPESDFALLPPTASPVRLLSATELATIRVRAPLAERMNVRRHGIPFQAAIRLAVFESRGELRHMSGWRVSMELQNVFHPRARQDRRPIYGVEILRAIDATSRHHGVSVTVGQGVSLFAYCAELDAVTP